MRIADIEVINLHFEYPEERGYICADGMMTGRVSSLIRVTTDTGLTGLGAVYSHPDLVRIIVMNHLKPHLLHHDPCDVESLWDKMYGLTRWYGRKGVALSALGGLDIAFWDLRGKALGIPLYKLLGAERDTVPAYASALLWRDDLGVLEREAAMHRAQGFHRVKVRLGRSRDYDVAAFDAVRRGVGLDGDIMVEGSLRYTLETAEWLGKVLASKKAFWFEEPLPPEDIDGYVTLRSRLSVPLAAGENDFGLQGFREMLQAGALDIVQPDACRAGGITECMRIGRLAAQSHVRVATHTWSDAVALIANAHVIAALPNGLTVEVDQTGNPFIEELLTEPLRIQDGLLHLPDAPGLGIELNPATVERLTLQPHQTTPDGSYADMIFGAAYLRDPPPYT